ncbi:hypothetical protein V8E54_008760 [Elaphomyces granulatus]
MLEVGFWKPTREIETDARGWIKTRGSPVRLVVKISIERNTPEIIIRRWELCRRENPSPRALAFSFSVSHAQEIGVLRSANPATGNLVLPFEEVMGRPGYLNNPLEHDFIISQAELEDMGKNALAGECVPKAWVDHDDIFKHGIDRTMVRTLQFCQEWQRKYGGRQDYKERSRFEHHSF